MSLRYSHDPLADRSLHRSVRDGVAWSVMVGSGESYLGAFAVFLKATTAQISLLAALPSLLGAITQLVSAWVSARVTRRKPLILGGVLLQALAWVPIAALAVIPVADFAFWLIASVALYYIGFHFASPPWSSLIGELVPARRRGRFFGERTRLISIASFVSLTAGGVTLELFERHELAHWGFVLLFAVALLARLYSWLQLALTHEPRPATVATPAAEPELPPRRSDFIRLATFVALMNFSVALASPFFTLYMLRDLAFSYLELTAVGALYVLMQFFALRGWGRLADAYGNRLILHITSLVFPLLPVLWVLLPTFWLVLAIQMLAGTCWAGFSLAANNSLYDVAPVGKRAGYSAWFQTVSHGAIFVGALLGGVIATHAPTAVAIAGTTFEFASGLWATMLVSSAARALTAATLLPTLRELRSVRTLTPGALAVRAIRVNVLADWLLELLPSRRRPPVR